MKKDEKRRQREDKRAIKKAGVRKMRRTLQRELTANPEEAHLTEFEYGLDTSTGMNGLDNDATRKKINNQESPNGPSDEGGMAGQGS